MEAMRECWKARSCRSNQRHEQLRAKVVKVAMYSFQLSLHMVCGVIWKVRAELYQVHPQTRRRVKVQPP